MSHHSCPPVYERRLDGGRIVLPGPVQPVLGSRVALLAAPAGCVTLMRPDVWEQVMPLLQKCSAHNHHAARLFALLAAGETSAWVDGRGRLTIPRLHMEWAGLTPSRGVLLLALGDTVELWCPERLDAHLDRANHLLRHLSVSVLREQLPLFPEAAT